MRQRDARSDAPDADPSGVGEIGDILGFRIRLAHVAVHRHFMETFGELEMTQKQVTVLWLVADNPGLAQIDLGNRLRMDRATTLGVVSRLEKRGLLIRSASRATGVAGALPYSLGGGDARAGQGSDPGA